MRVQLFILALILACFALAVSVIAFIIPIPTETLAEWIGVLISIAVILHIVGAYYYPAP